MQSFNKEEDFVISFAEEETYEVDFTVKVEEANNNFGDDLTIIYDLEKIDEVEDEQDLEDMITELTQETEIGEEEQYDEVQETPRKLLEEEQQQIKAPRKLTATMKCKAIYYAQAINVMCQLVAMLVLSTLSFIQIEKQIELL